MKAPILKGPRVTLRPLKLKDAENYVRWFRDKAVMRHFNRNVHNISLREEQRWIRQQWQKQNMLNWAIIVDEKHIGGTGIRLDKKNKSAHWGIVIGNKKEWGKGYAGEAIKLCADYVFKELKYQRLDLTVEMPNKKALKAYKKAGFKLEGVMRRSKYNPILKNYVDMGVMSILKKEWLKLIN